MPELSDFDPMKAIPDPDFRAPDLMSAVEGWRAWSIAEDLPRYGLAPKLISPAMSDFYWAPRKASIAECGYGCAPDQVASLECSCGFYSAKTREHLLNLGYTNQASGLPGYFAVVGRVANWGRVVEGSQGWRASHSYPVELFLPFEAWRLAKPLQDAYGIPVRLENVYNPDSLDRDWR